MPTSTVMFFLILVIFSITSFFVFIGRKSEKWQRRFHYMAVAEYPKCGLYMQARDLFEYMLTHDQLRNHETLFEYGLMLKRIKSEKADAVLQKSLAEQYQREESDSKNPDPFRRSGIILKLLGRRAEAEAELNKALEKDTARLKNVSPGHEKLHVLVSFGKTYFEIEDYQLALNAFKEAESLSLIRRDKESIHRWIQRVNDKLSEIEK